MPRFVYNARNGRGEIANGNLIAATIEEAGKLLRAEGKFITRLVPASEAAAQTPVLTDTQRHAKRVKRDDVIFFTHQLAIMLETGVPISDALDCITEQALNPSFKEVLRDITQTIQSGNELSSSLARYPKTFPPIMISLIKASEASGTMAQMLERISTYLAKERQIVKQAKGALMYPAFLVSAALGVTLFLMTFVLPKFAAIYSSRGSALPAPTRLLMAISNTLINHWQMWLAAAAGAVVGLFFFARSTPGKRFFDWLKLHTPVLKTVFTHLYVTRATRTMGTMINAGVSVLDAVAIVRNVTQNVYYQEMWDVVDADLRQGMQLSDPLLRTKLLPRPIVQMIRSGEKGGRVAQVLGRIAEFTEHEFDNAVKAATQFIEPCMVIVMGALVGFIAISLLLPIFSASRVMSGH